MSVGASRREYRGLLCRRAGHRTECACFPFCALRGADFYATLNTHTPLRSFSGAAEPLGQTLSPLGSPQALCDPPAPPLLLCLPSLTLCLVQAPGLSPLCLCRALTQPSALPSYEPHPHASSMSPLEKVLHLPQSNCSQL